MKRHAQRPIGDPVIYTAAPEWCSDCGRRLTVYQSDGRWVQGLDTMFRMVRRDKRCAADCPGRRPILYAPRDLRVVLPRRIYGLDVTLNVGERHLLAGVSLSQITRDLHERGVLVDQRHTGRVFRDFVALTQLARGDDEALRARLRAQGGIVLMCDGVQFDERSPVLYLVWDALSGEPLFGERKLYRSEADLSPLLERVRAMNVPIIGAVTDKEKGLVPAVEHVFPGTPYQYCQTHFLKNCAKPLADDLVALQASVRRRAEAVRELGKLVAPSPATTSPEEAPRPAPGPAEAEHDSAPPSTLGPAEAERDSAPPSTLGPAEAERDSAPPSTLGPAEAERDFVRDVCELTRLTSRGSGKAPLDPPELKRHERLEKLRRLVNDAREAREKNSGGAGTTGYAAPA